jgi:hypothetical protein
MMEERKRIDQRPACVGREGFKGITDASASVFCANFRKKSACLDFLGLPAFSAAVGRGTRRFCIGPYTQPIAPDPAGDDPAEAGGERLA